MCLTKRHTPRSFSTSEYASQAKVSTGLCKEHSEEIQGLPFASQNLQSCHLKRRPELRKLIELFHGFPNTPVCCPLPGSIWLHYRWKSPFLSSCEWKLPRYYYCMHTAGEAVQALVPLRSLQPCVPNADPSETSAQCKSRLKANGRQDGKA